MDLRPQNVFFDPRQGTITVIDIGMCVDQRATSGRQPALDIHDCLAELCKFYLQPQSPPRQAKGYCDPFGMGPPLGFTKELERMIQAGAKPMSLWSVLSEWTPDYTSAERQKLTGVTRERGGGVAQMADYVFAQVEAGLVPLPSFGSAPVEAGSR